MRALQPRGKRNAVSEVLGSLLAITITLVAGGAVWGFVNLQAGQSEVAYANSVGNTNGYLNEQFKVLSIYFGSSTSTTFWLYNIGSVNLQVLQVRLYDSAGLVNILYNYTASGGTKTDYVFDLRSSLAGKCKTAASTYESPAITTVSIKPTNANTEQLTIPGTQTNCPSFGQTFTAGTTYAVVVTGVNGNTVTFYQAK